MSLVLFVVIAALMSIDLTIEFRRGEPIALQTFELLIFTSALAGIAFHWWQMRSERRRSIALPKYVAAAVRAEVEANFEAAIGNARIDFVVARDAHLILAPAAAVMDD